jgi:hypothetical protein
MPTLDDPAAIQPVLSRPVEIHPLGSSARVLLVSVFGPYAQDDEFGSRVLNPMELYHNQVTRLQGPFSLRMFHRSWGLSMIQANIHAPCTVLDFPTQGRFIEEIRDRHYDIVGISSIISNVRKVERMCELVRQYLPGATIVVGGHIANVPDLCDRVNADRIVQGEGVGWFREFLGEDRNGPIRHPLVPSNFGMRTMGITLSEKEPQAAVLIPSVGCPMGCNFCSTSAMFGGKGSFVNFYESGDELFDVMCQLETAMRVKSFFVMDENFLLHRRRALRLLELMERRGKSWALYVFSSANALRSYSMDQLVSLGVSLVWLGLEGEHSQYGKLDRTDTFALVRELQSHGIWVLGSTIIGLESHTPKNIDRVIDYAVRHGTDFHQFMLYMPLAGTPLHADLSTQGRMKNESEYDPGDIHGQLIFNYRHPQIPDGEEGEMMERAFARDFEVNGPSLARMVRTTLAGWRRYKGHPDPRIRRRFAWEARELATTSSAVMAAVKRHYRRDPAMRARMTGTLRDLAREFGWRSRLSSLLGGPVLARAVRREEKRLSKGWTYEPGAFYEVNEFVEQATAGDRPRAARCRSVVPRVPSKPKVIRPPQPDQEGTARKQEPRKVSASLAR